jgi:hypothetical protein
VAGFFSEMSTGIQPETRLKLCLIFSAAITRETFLGDMSRHYDSWLETELGDQLRAARAATGGRARLECSGNMFLRALCKLTHRGYAQYVKGLSPVTLSYYTALSLFDLINPKSYLGDGDAFADFLEENYPGVTNNCLSRAEYSNRQDLSLEVSWELYPLLLPLLDYVVKTLLDDANVLR